MLRHLLEGLVEGREHWQLIAKQEAQRFGQQAAEHLAMHDVRALTISDQLKVVLTRDTEARAHPPKLAICFGMGDTDTKLQRDADVRAVVKRGEAPLGGRPFGRRHHRIPLAEPRKVSEHPPDDRRGRGDGDFGLNLGLAHVHRR